ncbi:iron-siderophore ABC transporter substrate-binding protein [Sinomonas halotolerans]|uniref:Iron-siderophore ABC transporter substrate-binding protein n=1 Tax=Sinomonas halotolerans TaxID=1644133 RepID=A0ABU9WZE3_9MICC
MPSPILSRSLSRRGLLGLSGLAAIAVTATACSTGAAGTAGGASTGSTASFPVTVKHIYGETVIEKQPTRVATVSWVNDDVALALGVVPVAVPKNEWGGNEAGSTPWKDAKLAELGASWGSEKAPVQYSEADGINAAEIAKAAPDLILAAYSGLKQEDYDKLSKIAPVVAFPEVAYGTPWQESTRLIGKALGKDAEAEKVIADLEARISEEAAKYPVAGKTFIYGNLEPAKGDGVNVYTASDNRPRFLSQLGMELAPIVVEKTGDSKEFYLPWSAEKADELASDVFVTWVPDAKTAKQITADPLLSQIPALKKGALVADSDNTLTLSVSAASPLSLPYALEKFLPLLGAAAEKA